MKRIYYLLIASAGFAATLHAQTPSGAPTSDEVLTLSEFNVTAKPENTYSSTDTVTGSRTDTKVKDLPYAISSVTSEFIKDFSIFDLTEELSYMSAVTGVDDSMAFTSRGFFNGANNNLVNGHFRLGLIDPASVDRVELIKGPSASIYGQTNPGGILAITTKRPRSSQHEDLSVSYGSYHTNVFEGTVTGPIPIGATPKLFYVVNAYYLHRNYDEPAQARFLKAASGTLLYKVNADTNISLDLNYSSFKNPNEFNLPYLVHTGTNPYTGTALTMFDGYAWQLRKGYTTSPVDWKWRRDFGTTLSLEHRFTSWLAFKASYDTYHNPIETYDTLRNSLNFDPTIGGFARSGATPTWSTIYGSGYSYSADLLAHYHIGNTDQQTLFTIDDYLNNRGDYTNASIAGSFTPITGTISAFSPVTSELISRDSAHFTTTTTRNNAVEARGFGLTHQANLFSDKLLVYVGYRHDHTTGYQSNPSIAFNTVAYTGAAPGSGRESHIHDSNDAGKYGFSLKITPSISWYANETQSFIPFGTSVALTLPPTSNLADPRVLKQLSPAPETGRGYETGFKTDLFDKSLQISTDVYTGKRENVGVTELSNPNDPSSPTVTVNEGTQKSKGFEFDADYRFTTHLRTHVSYSYTDSRLSDQGTNVFANGRRPRASAYNSFSAATNYTLMEGLSLLLSMRYQGNTPADSPITGLIKNTVTGLSDQSDGRALLRTPAYAVWNVGAIYTWKSTPMHLKQSLNFSAKNIFNKLYFSTGNNHYVGDGFGTYITYSIAH